MTMVQTVRGPVGGASLGKTLAHEHVVNVTDWIQRDHPELSWGGTREDVVDRVAAGLAAIKESGIATIVDCTATGHSRDVALVASANAKVDINIVCATGLYTYDALPHFLVRRPRLPGEDDILTTMFVRDIEVGIQGSAIRAGIIKCATDKQGVTPNIDRVLRAVARAHRLTGIPITTHSEPASRNGLEQQRIFREEGVDLSRVVIGHSGDSDDYDYLARLLDAGSFIGADRFGLYLEGWPDLAKRVEIVRTLVDRGYEDRILLSHDASIFTDWRPASGPSAPRLPPEWNGTHLVSAVIPALLEAGVGSPAIDRMLIDNPRRLLEAGAPY